MAVSYNFIKNDNAAGASTELTYAWRENKRKKKREKNGIAVARSCSQDSMAWNSLFKRIKIQCMQVFWREDELDCCYSV